MLAIIGNTNLDPSEKYFGKDNTYLAPFNQYNQELLDEDSRLYDDETSHVLLFLDAQEFVKEIFYSVLPNSQSLNEVRHRVEELTNSIHRYLTKKQNVVFVICDFLFPPLTALTFLDSNSELSVRQVEAEMNMAIREFALSHANVLIMDWKNVVIQEGYHALYEETYWYLGRIKLNNRGFSAFYKRYTQLIQAYTGKTKKVLIVDFDNTLWGGIVGETGVHGIVLSEEGIGKAYREFQQNIKYLKTLGVLIAVSSKNNEKDIEEVFQKNKMMVLQSEDFITKKISWNNKAQSIKEISEELGLGIDSFVVIDDSPTERALLRQVFPELAVPDFPIDPAELSTWFLQRVVYEYFAKVRLTSEDVDKTKQYEAKRKRDLLLSNTTLKNFIKSLSIILEVRCNDKQLIPRVAQLTQKTNQFNLTTKRYTEADIARFLKTKSIEVFTLNYKDKFGEEGITGCAICLISRDMVTVDTFLLSCRILGRDVEYAFLKRIIESCSKREIKTIKVVFSPNPKNVVAGQFYKSLPDTNNLSTLFKSDTIHRFLQNRLKKSGIKVS